MLVVLLHTGTKGLWWALETVFSLCSGYHYHTSTDCMRHGLESDHKDLLTNWLRDHLIVRKWAIEIILLVIYRTYLWFDEKGKKTRVAAPQYIDYVMTFTQKTISDENIFPTKYGKYPIDKEKKQKTFRLLLFIHNVYF